MPIKNNHTLPEDFFERLNTMYGPSLVNEIEVTFIQRPTTFRVNTIKANRGEVLEFLRDNNFKTQNVPWYPDAFILQNRTKRELLDTALYSAGKIYVQSLASMVPPLILDPKAGEKVLDLTAAPGSKTSQIAALMEQQGELIANDNNKVRFFKLKHNMELLGVADSERDLTLPSPLRRRGDGSAPPPQSRGLRGGLVHDGSNWQFTLRMEHGVKLCREYTNYFDKILLDAPCSAEARFIEGERETYGYWSERKIKEMAYKQRQLILSAWNSLKPGGTLVYSTCTFAPEENEMQVNRLIERYKDQVEVVNVSISGLKHLPVLAAWGNKQFHPEVKKCLRIMPTKEIEGFFVGKIQKLL